MYFRGSNRLFGYSVIVFIVTAFLHDVRAQQRVSAYVTGGYATYSYSELKDYQKLVQEESVEGSEITDDFSPFVTFALGVEVQVMPKFSVGLELGHGSTGGRVYYEDFSGRMVADQLVAYNYVHTTPMYTIHQSDKWRVEMGMQMGVTFHSLKIRNELTFYDETIHEKADFKATSLSFRPLIRVKRAMGENFFILGGAGYEIQSSGITRYSEDKEVFLDDGNGQPVYMKGDGFRISLGVGFKFPTGKGE